ncbi:hypothetical protein MHYP_G00039290 [Metynnis hypsauchen]
MTGQQCWEADQSRRYRKYVIGTLLGTLARPHVLVHHTGTFSVQHEVVKNGQNGLALPLSLPLISISRLMDIHAPLPEKSWEAHWIPPDRNHIISSRYDRGNKSCLHKEDGQKNSLADTQQACTPVEGLA